ncbi:MAG TPA: FAD-binding protein, partial [Bryobacteraceae bacterium]|nr:FAD-binding protein [Bryobacteraceae bacterium]
MNMIQPTCAAELSQALRQAAATSTRIRLGGGFTKDALGGTVHAAGVSISTAAMSRVLAYEPKDLTVSVEAGLPYAELLALLTAEGQMLPLDPPLAGVSTVGGVIAANLCGSRRRLYGTARDVVIGMSYCTLD